MPEGHGRARAAVLERDAGAGHPRRPARCWSPRTATAIRALVKYLDGICDDDIVGLNIPNGIPLVYELDADLKPIRSYYLGDAEAAAKAAAAVANAGQGLRVQAQAVEPPASCRVDRRARRRLRAARAGRRAARARRAGSSRHARPRTPARAGDAPQALQPASSSPTNSTAGLTACRARRSAAPPAAPASRWRSPPAAGWRGTAAARGRRRWCLRETPRPCRRRCSASAIWCTTRSASRLRSRSMNSVPAAVDQRADQRPVPDVGLGDEARLRARPRGSPGCRATRRGWPPAASAPGARRALRTSSAMPSRRSILADHQRMRCVPLRPRRGGGKRSAMIARPCSAVQQQRARRRHATGAANRISAVGSARRRRGRRPACSARGRAARSGGERERRVLALAAQRVGVDRASAARDRTRRGRRRRPRPAARRSPRACRAQRRARAPARW